MTATAIVGANWGDEGKGKITDMLAAESAYVVRFQGGSNAGHTIINGFGKFALHMLPSGVFDPSVSNVIGPGAALDIGSMARELRALEERNVPKPKLYVSNKAQVVLPIHRLFDELEEERLGMGAFGSTKRGIAPFYADKYAKLGIRVSDLYDASRLRDRLEQSLAAKNVLMRHLYGRRPVLLDDLLEQMSREAELAAPYVCDTTRMLAQAWSRGESILLEGQLGALRDPDHGIYPFTTSSSTLAGFAPVGSGLPLAAVTRVIAVTKAYSSCVGAGPFVCELTGADGEELRKRGGHAGEYGALTGRPRRVGWFDAVATRYGCMLQGATEAALTNLDVLGYLDEIPVCEAYRLPDGTLTGHFPLTGDLCEAEPVLVRFKGWRSDISNVRSFKDLPQEAQRYVNSIEAMIGVPISIISVGPHREQTIRL